MSKKNRYKKMIKHTPEEWVEIFQDIIIRDVPILNNDGERLIIGEDEIFRQCYDPEDTPRKSLPAFWFVSNKGNVIDISQPEQPEWRNKYYRKESNSYCYKYPLLLEDGSIASKNVEMHNLIGIVFDSYRFGKANKLLDENGLLAFGIKDKRKECVNGHHEDGNKQNNDYTNITMVSTPVHVLLDKVPGADAGQEKSVKFMQEFSERMDEENPGKITVITESPVRQIRELDPDHPFVKQIYDLLSRTIFIVTNNNTEKDGEVITKK